MATEFEGDPKERCALCDGPATQRATFYHVNDTKEVLLFCQHHAQASTTRPNPPRYLRPLPAWTNWVQAQERLDQLKAVRRLHRDQLSMNLDG